MRELILAAVAVGCLAAIIYNGIGSASSSVTGGLTTEFIAASLRDQEAAAGASLDVKYSETVSTEGSGTTVWKWRYVRTPEALQAEREDPRGVVERESYDRATGEWRLLQTRPDGRVGGRVRDGLRGVFLQQDLLETTRYPLPVGMTQKVALVDWVERGQLSEQTEDIDGHQCWRVEVTDSSLPQAVTKYVLWLDASMGFCPRRIDIVWAERPPKVITFDDYKEIRPGFWFPGQMVLQGTTNGGAKNTVVCKVEEVTAGTAIPKETLIITFPSGTPIQVGDPAVQIHQP